MNNKIEIKKLYTEDRIQEEIRKLGQKLNNVYQDKEVYLICVLKGSVMFMADLSKHLGFPVKMEFIRLSSYTSTASSGEVKAVNIDLPDLNEKNVLIIEDIIDSGLTAKFLVDYINNKFNVKSLKFCSLLNKKIRRVVDIDADYYCFDVDDKFIVGYGLDLDGCYRNLPYIGYIET